MKREKTEKLTEFYQKTCKIESIFCENWRKNQRELFKNWKF